jgi:hypothetical protein
MKDGNWSLPFKKLNPLWEGGCILILIFLLYIPSLNNYLMGDDFEILNGSYQGWQRPTLLFEKIAQFVRPLVKLSYLLTYTLFGTHVFFFNLGNVLLHLANLWLLFILVFRLLGRAVPSILVVLAFGVSALYSEVTLWTAARSDSIMMLFVLAALLLLFRHAGLEQKMPFGKHALLLLLAVGALLAKESWVILPFLALALLLLIKRIPLKMAFCHTFSLFLLLMLYLTYFVCLPWLIGKPSYISYGGSGLEQMANKAAFLVYKYFGLGDQFNGSWWQFLLLGLLAAAGLFFMNRRKNQPAFFGLFWMLLGIGVFLPVTYAPSRYNYMPLMGFWIMIVSLVAVEYREFARRHESKRLVAAVLLALSLCYYLAYQAIMLQWEIKDYRLRGQLHEQVASMYERIQGLIPADKPIIFIDRGERRAVFESTAAIKGYKKLLFARENAIWQQVLLAPLANFLRAPSSGLLVEVKHDEIMEILKGRATTLFFNDNGFIIWPDSSLQEKTLDFYSRYGELPQKVQILRFRKTIGDT